MAHVRRTRSERIQDRLRAVLGTLEGFSALCIVALEVGAASDAPWLQPVLHGFDIAVIAAFTLRHGQRGVFNGWRYLLRPSAVAGIAAVAISSVLGTPRIAAGFVLLFDGLSLARYLMVRRRDSDLGRGVLAGVGLHPTQSLVFSFAGLIAIGTLLLWLPAAAAHPDQPVALIDALFTAVSATCVTGLITLDTSTAWSSFGQGVIFSLFQLGALGILVISGAMTLALGQSLGARQGMQLQGVFDESDAEELTQLVRVMVLSTFAIEAVGSLLLTLRFWALGFDLPRAAVLGTFHAVSAFCNAGFSLFSDSIVGYAGDPAINFVLIALITLGGIGFGVMMGVWRYVRKRGRHVLTLHERLVLSTSLALTGVGALFYFFFEFDHSLAHLELGAKLQAALFQSVSARTAGFNSVPLADLHPVTILGMISLMFIGASPGSTGGGIKTTTIALVFLTARAFMKERQEVHAFGRTLPQVQVMRAFALTGGAFLSFAVGFGILLVTEDLSFSGLAFESASALGTAGLSMGITDKLSSSGRLVICVLMFFGRVGPLTAIAALQRRRGRPAAIALPEGKVLVG